jgi:hypothetical protein
LSNVLLRIFFREWHLVEINNVARDEDCIVYQGDCGNFQVHRTDPDPGTPEPVEGRRRSLVVSNNGNRTVSFDMIVKPPICGYLTSVAFGFREVSKPSTHLLFVGDD